MLAQVEGVGQAGRGALEFERPGKKKPRRSGARFSMIAAWRWKSSIQPVAKD